MNRSLVTFGVAAALLFGGVSTARAQDQGPGQGQGQGRRQRPSMVEQLKEPLSLTDDQTTKIKALEDESRAAMQKAREDMQGQGEQPDRNAMRETMRAANEKLRDQVRGLLTDEQKTKFDVWVKEQDARQAQRGQRGQGGGMRGPQRGEAETPAAPRPATGGDVRSTARSMASKVQKALVTVRLGVRVSVGDRDQDIKMELTGTVVTPAGLTVVSASALEPRIGGQGGRRGQGGAQAEIETEVTETKIVLADGTEVDAEVVSKDADLDLALLRPKTSTSSMASVDLMAPGASSVEALDDAFVVGRLGRALDHAPSLALGQVRSVVSGKGGFYVLDDSVAQGNVGCPAFAADGSILGVIVTKRAADAAGAAGPGMGGGFRGGRGGQDNQALVVRMASDIMAMVRKVKGASDSEGAKPSAPAAPAAPATPAKPAPKAEEKPTRPKAAEPF